MVSKRNRIGLSQQIFNVSNQFYTLTFSKKLKFIFFKFKADLNIGKTDESNWIIGNIKHSGFYRVNYDLENWNLLINQLNDPTGFEMIDVISRAQLLDDSFNLANAELINITIFFKLANYLKFETNNLPFQASNDGFRYISRMLNNDFFSLKNFEVINK